MTDKEKLKLATDTLKEVMRVVRLPAAGPALTDRNETFDAAEMVLAGLEYK